MEEIGYKFKRYIPKFKIYKSPAISIARGHIRLNQWCRQFIQKRPYCELFYDEDEKVIAIKPTQIDGPFSLTINNFGRNNNSLAIQCRTFILENHIAEYIRLRDFYFKAKSIQFPAQWDDKNKCFFINLKYFKEIKDAKQS